MTKIVQISDFHNERNKWLHKQVINLIKKDPKLRRQYLKDLQEPGAIYEEFGLIAELDIDSQDPKLKPYLDKFKE